MYVRVPMALLRRYVDFENNISNVYADGLSRLSVSALIRQNWYFDNISRKHKTDAIVINTPTG